MNLKNNGFKRLISNIILINLTGIMFLVLLISCYLETKSSEYLYGLLFLLLFVALDLLFFAIRKPMFSKVVIEDGKIKEKYFKKTLKEIDLKDIKFLYANFDNLFISSDEIEIEKTGEGRLLSKKLYSKQAIAFRINLEKLPEAFEPLRGRFCYTSNRVEKELKEKLKAYFNIIELKWEKKTKK